jgi:hypothetical protein
LKRLVFREVLDGDVKKFAAKSNISGTGGGARDFRYRPYDDFDDVFSRILTDHKKEKRTRDEQPVDVVTYFGKGTYRGPNGDEPDKVLQFEPPTTARPNEGRLTRLSSLGLTVPKGEGRVFLLIWQMDDDAVWLGFATQKQLEANAWYQKINDFLLECMNAKRPVNNAAQGFIDFERSKHFCNSSPT